MNKKKKGKLGAYTMKRVVADAHMPNPWRPDAQTIEPNTAWTAVPSLMQAPGTRFVVEWALPVGEQW